MRLKKLFLSIISLAFLSPALFAETCQPPLLISDGPEFSFGTRVIGSEVLKSFVLINSASTGINLMNAELNGAASPTPFSFRNEGWHLSGTCKFGAIAAGSSCILNVIYNPVMGLQSAQLKLTYDHNGTSLSVQRALSGTGREPRAQLSILEDLPNGFPTAIPLGSQLTKNVTITNVGELPATSISDPSLSLSNGFFIEENNCTSTLQAKESCVLILGYSPLVVGASSANLRLNYYQDQTLKTTSRVFTGYGSAINQQIFVTSESYSGNLGGISGADAKCQTRARAAGRSGKWRAILNDPNSIAIRGPVYDFKGNKISNSNSDFWKPVLPYAISTDEFGNTAAYGMYTWTGMQLSSSSYSAKYIASSSTCSNWTRDSSSSYGYFGKNTSPDYDHFSYGNWINCSNSLHLYCLSE